MRCKGCGKEFDFDEAASEFNSHFDGDFDYAFNGWEDHCADCAISGAELEKEEGIDDDGMPSGCAACGGDWPNCKTSCPMYDD